MAVQQGVSGSAAVVCLIVYDSVAVRVWRCGCVRQCGSVWQRAWQYVIVCAAVCGSAHGIMQCMRQCASVRLVVYGSASDSVRLSSTQCSSVMLQCGSVRQCGSMSGRVCQ